MLYEMRPHKSTTAHQTDQPAELVCSNSLKSEAENSAPRQLKQEMRRMGSMLLAAADAARVDAVEISREAERAAPEAKLATVMAVRVVTRSAWS